MEEINYNLTNKDFKYLYNLSEEIYNITIVVSYFCKNQKEFEELGNLAPIIQCLHNKTDLLYNYFINIEK